MVDLDRFHRQFSEDIKAFRDDGSGETMLDVAVGYWRGWPEILNALNAAVQHSGSHDDYEIRTSLVVARSEAAWYLARAGVRRGIDTSGLHKADQKIAEIIMTPDSPHSPNRLFQGATCSGGWPDYLGAHLFELPPLIQEAIADSTDSFMRIVTVLDVNSELGKKSSKSDNRKQSGVDAFNQGKTWRQVTQLLNNTEDPDRAEIDRVSGEIRRFAKKTNQTLEKKSPGRKRESKSDESDV
ncbi:hypothetical protein V7x_24750 [Crateriforma conspicua]|uniref:Uncharacterized protein n=1 Tax=Crateriforma conspicua TaxID=2527996 RepID=A0A5C6G0Z1_9PLAN|nr:hypothetical protein [Crateriforma conspicua]TWU66903.1 hypothetical protein V7x_24750 [Crateriforma conspicua]